MTIYMHILDKLFDFIVLAPTFEKIMRWIELMIFGG